MYHRHFEKDLWVLITRMITPRQSIVHFEQITLARNYSTFHNTRFFMAKLQKASTNFTQVSNLVLIDPWLTWKAKWLYAYLFSKPDNWSFSADRIKNEWSDWRESIQSWLRELETLWYISRKKLGNGSMVYYIGIEPKSENPTLDKEPKSENPKVGFPQSGKTPLISNTVSGTSNTNNTETSNIENNPENSESISLEIKQPEFPKIKIPEWMESDLTEFIAYWTESNPKSWKQRWQGEKFFDPQKRWSTWMRNAERWKPTSSNRNSKNFVWTA
jgi:hypothetical protein